MSLRTRTLKNERHFFKQEKMLIDNMNMHIDLQLMLLKESYPPEDVAVLRHFQKEIWQPL